MTALAATRLTRRLGLLVLAGALLAASACSQDGHFCVLGYSTAPNYDTQYRSVRVPIFKNDTFRPGLEFDLTREVIKRLQAETPYVVKGGGQDADTELTGRIVVATKTVINRNQLNEIREAETTLAVELVWRDLKTGEILSKPRPEEGFLPLNVQIPAAPGLAEGQPAPVVVELPETDPKKCKPVVIRSQATFIPELGESITTSYQKNVQRLANQIVSMMQKPW